MALDWRPLLLSLELSLITTLLLLVIGIPLAYWLVYTKVKIKPFLESIISLPLVLPPSVLGFYLLISFSPNSFFGSFIEQHFNLRLVFSFEGLVIASTIYSLPFMVHPIQSGLQHLPPSLKEASYTLGKSEFETLFRALLPNIRTSLFTGIILTFAHTLGEFGVVLLIGGNIPGETKLASIAVYEEVESMNYSAANFYATVLLLLSIIILTTMFWVNRRLNKRFVFS